MKVKNIIRSRIAIMKMLWFLILQMPYLSMAVQQNIKTIDWVVQETSYTRLCSTKSILTVNGEFPGPALHLRRGETVYVKVRNQGTYNVTIHWHGVKQPRNPWSDGPEYVTQCPIKPGANFTYEVTLTDEEGTVWWHAHSDWSRATVHGPIIIRPPIGIAYPFPEPEADFSLVLASWYKVDIMAMITKALETGGAPSAADAFTINGQPGDTQPCSTLNMTKFKVKHGKTYLFRVINAILNEEMFFMVANHSLTVVAMDAAYIKPIKTSYIMITPGQTMDILIKANQRPEKNYYIAAGPFGQLKFLNATTTAFLSYSHKANLPSSPLPDLPSPSDINASTSFTNRFRALANRKYPVDVPHSIDKRILMTVSLNLLPCSVEDNASSCDGPEGDRLSASLNNISFAAPSVDILQAYYKHISGIYSTDFPDKPEVVFNYIMDPMLGNNYTMADRGTRVIVLEYNSNVELVFQGTNVFNASDNHPMHLHGYSFYFVGSGFGIFDAKIDPKGYNLDDPPFINTVGVPRNGWAAVRFRADNPGVWFMHCHLEAHVSWGMGVVLIVKNGPTPSTSMKKPTYITPC